MCLVAFSWRVHPHYPLLISANRDEFFDRPTQFLHRWDSGITAGKDLRGGGTWMGFHPNGNWALLTNFRDFHRPRKGEISRGKLVENFLLGSMPPDGYLKVISKEKDRYEGFNLLVSDGKKLFYFSNYGKEVVEIPPGIHGLSNGLFNEPWPKVTLAKKQLAELDRANEKSLLDILKSPETYPLELLPKTGASAQMEIELSAQMIRLAPNYGTVSATAVIQNQTGITQITERTYHWNPEIYSDQKISFQTSNR